MVFIADPQLVDPHTYPGRPWPLSTLTERYTDLYMARNFRLINERLDPDSILFLGDLFDGGREWAPDKPMELKRSQKRRLVDLGIVVEGGENERGGVEKDTQHGKNVKLDSEDQTSDEKKQKRSLRTYAAAMSRPHNHMITKAEHNIGKNGEDLKAFTPGENGRWLKWGNEQWLQDLERFSKIFFTPNHLYPVQSRKMLAAYNVPTNPTSVENGANERTWQEYATSGGKQRTVITSLPGNHDLGFGPGVQLVVRDRFESHFGDGNRIDVIGNHTIVSLDVLSLAAHSYYKSNGYETDFEPEEYGHIWKEGMDFLENLRTPAHRKIAEALEEYYPDAHRPRGWTHEVTDTGDKDQQAPAPEVFKEVQNTTPELPIILLSHVPLFRSPDTSCGTLRERGHAIRIAMGYQYQNVLTQTLSKDIVTKISDIGDIVSIFSGDDHDYCEVTHRYNIGADNADVIKTKLKHIREITVKSFSWAMGVRKPGFLLVSLWNPVDKQGNTVGTPLPTLQTHLCLLPDQLGIFLDYGLLFALTLPVLVVRAIFVSLRGKETVEDASEDTLLSPLRVSLPYFSNGVANSPSKSKKRQRGSSTTSSHSRNNSAYLGVQRSYNARTRSVSPTPGSSANTSQPVAGGLGGGVGGGGGGGLIDKAGYFPQVKWMDPADDEDSDEESHLGGEMSHEDDSQAKWKWRRRTPHQPGKVRRVLEEFAVSLAIVAVPGGLWYVFLVKNG